MNKQVHSNIYSDTTEFILQFQVICSCFCSLQGLTCGALLSPLLSSPLRNLTVHFRALQTPTPAGRRTQTCPWRRTLRLWGRRPTDRRSPRLRKQRSESDCCCQCRFNGCYRCIIFASVSSVLSLVHLFISVKWTLNSAWGQQLSLMFLASCRLLTNHCLLHHCLRPNRWRLLCGQMSVTTPAPVTMSLCRAWPYPLKPKTSCTLKRFELPRNTVKYIFHIVKDQTDT